MAYAGPRKVRLSTTNLYFHTWHVLYTMMYKTCPTNAFYHIAFGPSFEAKKEKRKKKPHVKRYNKSNYFLELAIKDIMKGLDIKKGYIM